MPSIGLSPFLREAYLKHYVTFGVCQCPQSGFPHFYIMKQRKRVKISFMCQCPQSGFPHFYYKIADYNRAKRLVSMPSIGLSPFLQEVLMKAMTTLNLCQCPQSGFPHFYTSLRLALSSSRCVSMPSIGLSPFLRSTMSNYWSTHLCVNALNRAFPISTDYGRYNGLGQWHCVNALNRAFPISTN